MAARLTPTKPLAPVTATGPEVGVIAVDAPMVSLSLSLVSFFAASPVFGGVLLRRQVNAGLGAPAQSRAVDAGESARFCCAWGGNRRAGVAQLVVQAVRSGYTHRLRRRLREQRRPSRD